MFLAFGIALLMPWNATLAAMDYFKDIFPSYEPSFSFLLAVSVPMLGMQVVSFTLQTIIPIEVKLTCALFVNMMVTLLIATIPNLLELTEKTCYYVILSLMLV